MPENYYSLILTVIFGGAFAFDLYMHQRKDRVDSNKCRYSPIKIYRAWQLLPVVVIILCIIDIFHEKNVIGQIFVHMLPVLILFCLYSCVLLFLLPLLRRFLSAQTCAMLWIIPPCFACYRLFFIWGSHSGDPLAVIQLPFQISGKLFFLILSGIWFVGFAAILLWQILSHLRFRRFLLKDAVRIDDSEITDVWCRELHIGRFQEWPFRLMRSPNTQTPLSIGLFLRTTCVVLPEREYTAEELALVLRHELVHIGRRDSLTKLYMVFMTALFWFNPFMWIAMRRCADDLELSCDETVLKGEQQPRRQQYAGLLLQTVADQRGFTTCLSASAKTLHYRLKNVVKPGKRLVGGITAGILTVVLLLSCFYIDFSFDPGTVEEKIFQAHQTQPTQLRYVDLSENGGAYPVADQEALLSYLSGLKVSRLMKTYDTYEGDRFVILWEGQSSAEEASIVINERYIKAYNICYYLEEGVDWQFIKTLAKE